MKLAGRVLVSIVGSFLFWLGTPGGYVRQDLTRCPARVKCGYPASSRAARPREQRRGQALVSWRASRQKHKRPARAGLLRKRLKGFEPSTFCMATGSSDCGEGAN